MVTVDDLSPGKTLKDQIIITVKNINWDVRDRRAVVDAIDIAGNPIRLIDFEGADIDIAWAENTSYTVSQCEVKSGSGGFELQLEPSSNTQIEPAENEGHVNLLFMSDTHIGYNNRVGGHGDVVDWVSEISPSDSFIRACVQAVAQDVDAVIHAGDYLDHVVDSTSLKSARGGLLCLSEENIPFYFIMGSHDRGLTQKGQTPDGVKWLRQQVEEGLAIELSHTGSVVSNTDLQLYGIPDTGIDLNSADNFNSLSWSPYSITFEETKNTRFNVLCLHGKATPRHSNQKADIDLSRLLNKVNIDFDCILIGDEHRPLNNDFDNGYDFEVDQIPVIYTGPTDRVGSVYAENPSFVTQITLSPSGVQTERYVTSEFEH